MPRKIPGAKPQLAPRPRKPREWLVIHAREQIGRLGRQISLGHCPVELRLRHGLIAGREQLRGHGSVSRTEAFGPAGDFVPRIKVATRAAKHSESFLHDRISNA